MYMLMYMDSYTCSFAIQIFSNKNGCIWVPYLMVSNPKNVTVSENMSFLKRMLCTGKLLWGWGDMPVCSLRLLFMAFVAM